MDNLTMFNLIVGFLIPLVISTINQPSFSSRVRVGVMVGVSLAVGFATCYFDGSFNAQDITTSVLTVIVAAITAYEGIFKPTGVAQKVELATSKKTAKEPTGLTRAEVRKLEASIPNGTGKHRA